MTKAMPARSPDRRSPCKEPAAAGKMLDMRGVHFRGGANSEVVPKGGREQETNGLDLPRVQALLRPGSCSRRARAAAMSDGGKLPTLESEGDEAHG
jgi:hypothetical protein